MHLAYFEKLTGAYASPDRIVLSASTVQELVLKLEQAFKDHSMIFPVCVILYLETLSSGQAVNAHEDGTFTTALTNEPIELSSI